MVRSTMFRPLVGLLPLIVLLSSSSGVGQRVELPIKLHKQHTAVWCWAATIAMVVEYTKRFPLEDCAVLSEYDMRLGGYGLCCFQPNYCNRAGTTSEMASILGGIFQVHGVYHQTPLSYKAVVNQIDKGRPIIAGLQNGYSGHVVVISGYERPNRVVVLDPIFGRAVTPYQNLIANWQYGWWTETFLIHTDPSSSSDCKLVEETIYPPVACMTPFGPSTCPGPPQNRARIICR